MTDFSKFMLVAIDVAELSLREGNCGFGAVVVKDGEIVAESHDTEKTTGNPTAHAELTTIVWSRIETVAYGYSIQEALQQGRKCW